MFDIEEGRIGLNPAFVRHVWAKKKGWVPPPAHPHEFKTKLRRTQKVRDERKRLAERAAAIDAETRTLKFDPADAAKTAAEIMVEVALKHGVSKEQIRSSCRAHFLVAVKYQAIARIYVSKLGISLPQIGAVMGGRDHTTILHAVQKMGVWRGSLG